MNADPSLTKARIARKNGISRARVTQIMSMLTLPEEIIRYVVPLRTRQDLRIFSFNRLRRILSGKTVPIRLAMFEQLCQEYQAKAER